VVLTLHASTEATGIAPSCPRTLETALASAPCSPHMGRLLTMPRTTIDSTDVQDVCFGSLRALVAASASIPCLANVNFPPTSSHSHMRRLRAFKGKLNCTFDKAAPLNLSNPRQSFIIYCKEIPGREDRTWTWIVLGVCGAPYVLCILYFLIRRGVKKIKSWRDERAQRALDRINDMPKSRAWI
jgi:hypothetical protein